jgi:uncharacterized membrane protein (UPF0127 family)
VNFVNKRVAVLLAALTLAVPGLAACTHGQASVTSPTPVPNPSLNLPQGNLAIARPRAPSGTPELSLHLQIAETAQAQEAGLMNVKKMSDQAGMAFLFKLSTTTAFWMKDTLIPLDIAFWDGKGTIVATFTMTPCTADPCHLYQPTTPYVGSVEMNSGLLAAHGVQLGDTVTLTR